MMRVGLGYDIHRTGPGDAVTLGGTLIAAPFALVGHSDADVALHALMDALLGAAALGDIGDHFPPSDDRFRHASSLRLLDQVYAMIQRTRLSVVNADLVIIAEQPRIAEYRRVMQRTIAESLHCPLSAIGVKATTNEGVGPEGRLEAISAHAVVLLEDVS